MLEKCIIVTNNAFFRYFVYIFMLCSFVQTDNLFGQNYQFFQKPLTQAFLFLYT